MEANELEALYKLTEKGYEVFIFPVLEFTGITKDQLTDITDETKFLINFYFKNAKFVEIMNKRKHDKKERIQYLRKRSKDGKKAAGEKRKP